MEKQIMVLLRKKIMSLTHCVEALYIYNIVIGYTILSIYLAVLNEFMPFLQVVHHLIRGAADDFQME
jgi:hypothetical protein